MEPLVLLTGGLFSAAFIVLKIYAVAAAFFGLTFVTAWGVRRYDERRFGG